MLSGAILIRMLSPQTGRQFAEVEYAKAQLLQSGGAFVAVDEDLKKASATQPGRYLRK